MFNWLLKIFRVYKGLYIDYIEYNKRKKLLYKNADLIGGEGYIIKSNGTLYKKKINIGEKDLTKAQLLSLQTYSDFVLIKKNTIFLIKVYPYSTKRNITLFMIIPIITILSILLTLLIWLNIT
jgi:hypothetical protein